MVIVRVFSGEAGSFSELTTFIKRGGANASHRPSDPNLLRGVDAELH